MTEQVQKPHYQVEDIPPDDVDTKLQLFEQSTDVVKGSAEAAEWLRKNAKVVLGHVFETAEKAKDTELAERVNDVWERVQAVTTIVTRQSAVIAGSKEALAALKAQRDKVIEEIKGIREALNSYDTDHPELADYAETLQEMFEEDGATYWDEWGYDVAYNDVHENLNRTFCSYARMSRKVADRLTTLLLSTPGLLTNEQKDLLRQLGKTLSDTEAVNEPEAIDDEEGESDD